MWLFYVLVLLCAGACSLTGVCHWSVLAALFVCLVIGLAAGGLSSVRLKKGIAVGTGLAIFFALCGFEFLRQNGLQTAVLGFFLNLIWGILAYRIVWHEKVSDRLQCCVLLLIPLACLSYSMPGVEFTAFLFVYLFLLFVFFGIQSLNAPSTGGMGYVVSRVSGAPHMGHSIVRNRTFWTSLLSLLVIVFVVGGGLFLVVPRYRSGDVSGNAVMTRQATAAFPDVALDKTGKIDLDPSLVFRSDVPQIQEPRYWRIDVQNTFDGKVWRNSLAYRAHEAKEETTNRVYRVEFIREWYDVRMPVLRGTHAIRRLSDDSSRMKIYVDPFNGYQRRGWPPYTMGFEFDLQDEGETRGFDGFRARDIWPNRDVGKPHYVRLKQFAERIAGDAQSAKAKADRIEAYLKQHYSYSLERPERRGSIVEDFLFEQKFGHCEVFSTTMAVLLSLLDVPVRNASGFASSEYRDGYHLIRAAHAHSWVEVKIDEGWVLYDPTPSGAAQVEANWRVRINDWLDSYRTDKLYRWIGENVLSFLAIILGIVVIIALFFGVRTGSRYIFGRVEGVRRATWRMFIAEVNALTRDKKRSDNEFETWYKSYLEDNSALGMFIRMNIEGRFRREQEPLSFVERVKTNAALWSAFLRAKRVLRDRMK